MISIGMPKSVLPEYQVVDGICFVVLYLDTVDGMLNDRTRPDGLAGPGIEG